jgi:lipopolysaccharide transport system ATP-binding protein
MSVIELNRVSMDLPVLGISARSLRKTMLSLTTGGRMMQGADVVSVRALDDVSFKLEEGDRLGLLGHNGSGKSTLLRLLAGVYAPSKGIVSVNGRISAAIDISMGLDLEATGEENIRLLALYRGYSKREVAEAYDDIVAFSELGAFVKLPVKTYSAGMQARLAFSVATSFHPDVVLMDEWITTGDEGFVAKAQARLTDYVDKARAMVLASHNKDVLRRICNKVLILEHGKVRAFGPAEDVLA